MKIKNVSIDAGTVSVGERFKITFSIEGALAPFQFPFQNDSLTEKTIIFIKKEV